MNTSRLLLWLACTLPAACAPHSQPSVATPASLSFALDPHRDGQAAQVRLQRVLYGREVELRDAEDQRILERVVVGERAHEELAGAELEAGEQLGLDVLRLPWVLGTPAMDQALAQLEQGLVELPLASLDPDALPPYPSLPRDAALVLVFDDGVSASELEAPCARLEWEADLQLQVPIVPQLDAQRLHQQRSTRVVLNLAAARARVPLSGALRLHWGGGQSARWVAQTLHFAPGSSSSALLADFEAPRVVGLETVQIVALQGGPLDYTLTLDFQRDSCASILARRSRVETSAGVFVVRNPSAAPSAGTLSNVAVRLVSGTAQAGAATLRRVYDPQLHAGQARCFVEFTQAAGLAVHPDTSFALHFSEPMDLASLDPFEGLVIHREGALQDARARIVGTTSLDALDARRVLFTPAVALDHDQGNSEPYRLSLSAQAHDLAGNPLLDALPSVGFGIQAGAATVVSGGLSFGFDSLDMLGADGLPEFRGQYQIDLNQRVLRPRPVSRFSAVCDRTQALPSLMTAFSVGVQTPLTPLGAKLQQVWRYCDVGLSLEDESTTNIDIEKLYWAPLGGAVVADAFPLFEMSFAHSQRLPDESVSPLTLLPVHPQSGLDASYDANLLDAQQDPLRVVHPRVRGYTVNPAERVLSASGASFVMPWPLNQGIPASSYQYYTWRDTALTAKGAVGDSPGAQLRQFCELVLGQTNSCTGCPYPQGQVPSLGLPLLMEFRCFPAAGALGLNALDVSLAVNSSSRPNFRAFSSGGINFSGTAVTVDPDNASVASGGFNPSSVPPGIPTLGVDNILSLGQMDLVVRVSRMHSIWFDTQLTNPVLAAPIVQAELGQLPPGTTIQLDWRGAQAVSPLNAAVARNAQTLDAYGDPALCPNPNPPALGCAQVPGNCHGSVVFAPSGPAWTSATSTLSGSRWVQCRLTLISNAASGERPALSGLGLAWRQ